MRKAPVIRCANERNMIILHGAQGPSEIICNNINSTNIEKKIKRIHKKMTNFLMFVFQFKPSEFAAQINLSMDNCWGIVRCIIDQVMSQKVFLKN